MPTDPWSLPNIASHPDETRDIPPTTNNPAAAEMRNFALRAMTLPERHPIHLRSSTTFPPEYNTGIDMELNMPDWGTENRTHSQLWRIHHTIADSSHSYTLGKNQPPCLPTMEPTSGPKTHYHPYLTPEKGDRSGDPHQPCQQPLQRPKTSPHLHRWIADKEWLKWHRASRNSCKPPPP